VDDPAASHEKDAAVAQRRERPADPRHDLRIARKRERDLHDRDRGVRKQQPKRDPDAVVPPATGFGDGGQSVLLEHLDDFVREIG
jgi:hypothetical protein